MDEVVKDVEVLVKRYHSKVEQEAAVMINPDSYLSMQLLALTEQLSQLQNICTDQQLLSLQHRLLLHTPTSPPPQGWAAAQLSLSILHSLDRPAVKQLHLTKYDPLHKSLARVKTDTAAPEVSVGVFSSLVNVRDASGSTAIAMAEQKIEQLKEMKDILSNIKFDREEFSSDDIMAELSSLVQALVSYYGCLQSESLEENLSTLLDCPPHFKGFSLLLSEILDLLAKEDSSEQKVMKLELLLNCLKLQLFSLVGPIDPAEKQAIKQKYAVEGLEVVGDRIRVMDTFSEVLGVTHPHRDLLARRKEMFVEEVGRRKCLTAVRGEEASFVSLSKDLTHFVQTVGSSNTVLTLFSSLEMMTTSCWNSSQRTQSCYRSSRSSTGSPASLQMLPCLSS